MKVHLANSNAWSDGNEYIMGTASEVHTNALFDIYPNDTTITAEFKGNTVRSGTPSPSAPVPVVGVGYLDGAAYIIPVEIGLSTQSINLSSVQSTRIIRKVVLDGTDNYGWLKSTARPYSWYFFPAIVNTMANVPFYCTHGETVISADDYAYGKVFCDNTCNFGIFPSNLNSPTALRAWLAEQNTNGTPVIAWFVQETPSIAIINEPLQKIGNYADSISNITLTTTAGAKSFGVDTAVKPSEITLNFRGWHPKDPKESTGGEWS